MTDIERYDTAVYQYLVNITPTLIYGPTSIASKQIAKLKTTTDKIPWSFISYYRNPVFEFDSSRDNYAAQSFGDLVSQLRQSSTITNTYVHNIPINLTYTVDIWAATNSRVQEVALSVIERLCFTDKVLTAPINPGGVDARFHILDLEWVDNSDIENEDNVGRIYRHTISFSIDARIKLVRTTTTVPFDLTKLPVNLYEGEDIDDQTCNQCDFELLKDQS